MSVNSMAELAAAANRDRRPRLRSASPVERRPESIPTADDAEPAPSPVKTIVAYIPGEIVAAYVAAVAAIATTDSRPGGGQWLLMWIVLSLTPATVWTTYAAKVRAENRQLPLKPALWPWVEMMLASFAFMLWAFSLPNSPFVGFDWYKPALGSVVLPLGTLSIGMIASVLRAPAK